MKATILSTVVALIFFSSCIDLQNEPSPIQFTRTDETLNVSEEIHLRSVKYFPIPDKQRNMVMALMPIPKNWELSNNIKENVFLEGPNALKVFYIMGNEFVYTQNHGLNQMYAEIGMNVKPIESFEQVLEQLKGFAKQGGARFIRQYDLPQFVQKDFNYDQQIYKATPEQRQFKVVATEWEDDNGLMSLAIIHYTVAQNRYGYTWGYNMEAMEAKSTHFEVEKRNYLNALLNTQMNTSWITTINNQNRQTMQQQTAAHNTRMQGLRAQGQQIIAAGKQHDAMTTSNHEKFMKYIKDEITVTSPSTGQSYNVDMGSNHYWINDQNQLITSNDATYNPNANNIVQGEWVEAQINY